MTNHQIFGVLLILSWLAANMLPNFADFARIYIVAVGMALVYFKPWKD